jgi:tRNA A-37 threonylcarbamoyl transferase component Bud32
LTPDRLRQVRQLFEAALEIPPSEQAAFLRARCEDDEMLAEIRKLLSSRPQADGSPQLHSDSQVETVSMAPDRYIGSLLGNRYLIERKLGQGGFGVVYLARDTQVHHKPVVVKVLLEKLHDTDWFLRKFREESEALARINHPGVVGVLDRGETQDQQPFLVMEFVEGISLRALMRQGKLKLDRIAALTRQIAIALDSAHHQGVCHRDLKPENIMIRDMGGGQELPVIIDFGVATVQHSDFPEGAQTRVAGSRPYMAPEQLAGRPEAATDIYALGVIVLEMITGRRPFQGDSSSQEPFGTLRGSLPEAVRKTILKALSFDPKSRHASALEFGDELSRALAPWPLARPRRYFLVTAGGALALAGVAAWHWKLDSGRVLSAAEERILTYYVWVQQYRNGGPAGEPFRLAGEMLFPAGYHIRLVFNSRQPGYLYIINEAPAGNRGSPSYNVLFPSPSKAGSALVRPEQETATPSDQDYFVFDEQQGEEKLWIVWAKAALAEMEAVKKWVNPHDRGTVGDLGDVESVRGFLLKYSTAAPSREEDEAGKRIVLRKKGDLIVYLLRLQHH